MVEVVKRLLEEDVGITRSVSEATNFIKSTKVKHISVHKYAQFKGMALTISNHEIFPKPINIELEEDTVQLQAIVLILKSIGCDDVMYIIKKIGTAE